MMETLNPRLIKGGEFIIATSGPEQIFCPEEMNEEQRMVHDMVTDFYEAQIVRNRERIEDMEEGLAPSLLRQMGDLGLLGAHIPQAYGGSGMDTNTSTLIADVMGPSGSFTVSYGAHIGIGMLPILFFGTEEQKQKYLPKLVSGEYKASYCLTEPGSGSDALAARTRADLNPEGTHYLLNGQKMWISNAGFADVFIVFAKIDGEKFTCFIVEKGTPGLSLGEEEKKMGIQGSSTRQVFFENAPVPVSNILGEIGRGHLIAFNALNIGRFKLGAMCLGGMRRISDMSIRYALERFQFKQPIASFGAIRYKLAEQAIRTFAAESTIYRVSNLMQEKARTLIEAGKAEGEAEMLAAQEYAIESSIIKVYSSEALDYLVDENVQIHGGIGFSEEFMAARAYRDSRVNRIYEGTNEINRLLMVDQLLKRAMKGTLDLVGPAWEVQKELASMPSMETPEGLYALEKKALQDFKKIILMTAGAAVKMQMDGKLNIENEQEILMNVADMLIDVYHAESLLLRVEKLRSLKPRQSQEVYDAILEVFFSDATHRIQHAASDALASFAEGDLLRTFLMGLKRYLKYPPVNVKEKRRLVADALTKEGKYCL